MNEPNFKFYKLKFKRKGEEFVYTLDNKDILDLLRAIYKEGPPQDAVTWTLISRFAWLYPSGHYETLSEFVKAYSQPINPRWFPIGDKFQSYIRYIRKNFSPEDSEKLIEKELEKAERRIEFSELEYDEIPSTIKNIVFNVLEGNSPNPVPGALHFSASKAQKDMSNEESRELQLKETENRPDLLKPIYTSNSGFGFNWFFSVKGSDNFLVNIIPSNISKKEPMINIGLIDSPKVGIILILGGIATNKIIEFLKEEYGYTED